MTNLAVIGAGYVGIVSAACFAKLGHRVHCIDIDAARVSLLQGGKSPIFEPGLEPLIHAGLTSGRLTFASTYPEQLDAEIVFIAVDTPGSPEGAADLRAVRDAVSTVAGLLPAASIVVNKSTVPIGTGELVSGMAYRSAGVYRAVVSNPEFLREGSAVHDFLHPERVVLGSDDQDALERVAALYRPLGAPVQLVDIRTAEMIKYASNAFLATKISFVNELSTICDALGADIVEVTRGMGTDSRIGPRFLESGLGWGGSCFPKDVRALAHMAAVHGANPQLLRSVVEINQGQRLRVVRKLRERLNGLEGKRVVVLGAAFKPQTDDIRNSPGIELARLLLLEGAAVTVCDPVVPAARLAAILPETVMGHGAAEASEGADALVLATAWPQYLSLPFGLLAPRMRTPLIFDARNALDPAAIRSSGLAYLAMGRPRLETEPPKPMLTEPSSEEALV